MPALRTDIDADGLLEYSVVFTDRSLNHMSAQFQTVMRDISGMLKQVYNADAVAIIPGGGSYGMEAVARQIATDETVLVVRNGWFSYRWSQIFEAGDIPANEHVMTARRSGNEPRPHSRRRPPPTWPPRLLKRAGGGLHARMWKPRPGLSCRMRGSKRWPKPPMPSVHCWCWTA